MFKNWSAIVIGLATTGAMAATPVDLKHQPASALQKIFSSSLAAAAQTKLQQIQTSQDFNHTSHTRLKQTFAGYPVWGAEVVVHVPQGKTFSLTGNNSQASMNGLVYQDLQKDLAEAPKFIFASAQSANALQSAKNSYQHTGKIKGEISQEKTKLMVYVDAKNKAHWAFLVNFMVKPAQGRPAKPTYILDAENFTVYKNWDDIKTMDTVDGGGFGGNFKMGMLTYDGGNGHLPKLTVWRDPATQLCYLENTEVQVTNASRADNVIQYKCKTPNKFYNNVYWDGMQDGVNFGFSPGNDALYAGAVIKAMYKDWYNVDVLHQDDGSPMMLHMRVHDKSFEGLENAYWDGKAMTFGDGLFMFYPLVSLGVGAHEISHGFTEQHSNLVYDVQSGGLNEAFSDMAAQAAEFYSGGKNSWQIGSEVTKAKGQALRYMDEPTKDCKGTQKPGNMCSINNANDYNDDIDVHFTSGVFNKAFYLLGTSDGWNTRKAFDVMVQANMSYWTSTTNFTDAACGVIKATQDYKYDVTAVKNAFTVVGIDTSSC